MLMPCAPRPSLFRTAGADWPDAFRANRWVRGESADISARGALSDFERFPRWMWRNSEVVRFLAWLHDHNAHRGPREQAGFYLRYLRKVDPAPEIRARQRYACFDPFGVDTQACGYATTFGLEQSCEQAVIGQLVELQRKAADYASRDGRVAERVVRDAEAYYRAMFGDGARSWNLRDRHMMSTLEAIIAHVTRLNGAARAVIWAHNSHLGDARATQMSAYGELNVGQLVRAASGTSAIAVGFTTHEGSVTAALNWDEPAALMAVRPAIAGSYERLFQEACIQAFALDLRGSIAETLRAPRLERAIGVVYRPQSERQSHYFTAALPEQFDVVVHCDRTRAVEPLERWSRHESDLPETWPTGV
jgi:erythromycin esterase-like protein